MQDIKEKGHTFERDELNKIIDVAAVRADPAEAQKYVLCGMERCDDTKASVKRLKGWLKLAKDPVKRELMRGKKIIEVIVPSRLEIPYYAALYEEAQGLVRQINEAMGETVVHHIDKINSRKDVIAAMYYTGTFIVTPEADGFNMSAAEAAVIHAAKGDGTLMFSSRIGFADSLREHGLTDAAVFVDDISENGIAAGLEDALSGKARLTPERCGQMNAYLAINHLRSWQQDNVRRCLEAACEAHIELAA
jgi:trehalose-6-phosphate synthase